MKKIIDRITANYENRLASLKADLKRNEDWVTLKRVLEMDEMDCFTLFRKTNNSLEDIANLHSMLVNCLLDDSSFMVDAGGKGMFSHLYIAWGNDGEKRVDEAELNHIIDLLEVKKTFAEKHKDALWEIEDMELVREYLSCEHNIEKALLDLASDRIKKKFKQLKNEKQNASKK
jgi:hypothetical protein